MGDVNTKHIRTSSKIGEHLYSSHSHKEKSRKGESEYLQPMMQELNDGSWTAIFFIKPLRDRSNEEQS